MSNNASNKIKSLISLNDFFILSKARLSLSVVFSSLSGYFLAPTIIDFQEIIFLSIGGFFLAGSSNAFNQIIEKDYDKKMQRTKNRPIPTGRMSVTYALFVSVFMLILGLISLYVLNPITAMFGAISVFIYTCIYTPLKSITPLSVFLGAIPGAIPFMLGWVSATNDFSIEPGILFMIQFFWQFPHFWAIAWMTNDDYSSAGLNLLPTRKKDNASALQIILYSIWTIVISIFPAFGFSGTLSLSIVGVIIILILGLIFLFYALNLYTKKTKQQAKKLMIFSIVYISLLQITYVFDKFI